MAETSAAARPASCYRAGMIRLVLLPLLLSACVGAVQVGPPAATGAVTLGEGATNEIVIARAASFGLPTTVGAAPEIQVDGVPVGRCAVGRQIVVRVPDGRHTVSARIEGREARVDLSLAAGARRAIDCGASQGLSPTPTLALDG